MLGGKKTCPVCGNKMGFFGSTTLKDGKVCERCFTMAQIARGELTAKNESLVSINRYIWDYANERENLIKELGPDCRVFRVVSKGIADLEEILVGPFNYKALNRHVYVFGHAINGTFKDRMSAYIIHDGLKIPVMVMAAVGANEKDDLSLVLSKEHFNEPVHSPASGKLVLNIANPDMVEKGDYIVLK